MAPKAGAVDEALLEKAQAAAAGDADTGGVLDDAAAAAAAQGALRAACRLLQAVTAPSQTIPVLYCLGAALSHAFSADKAPTAPWLRRAKHRRGSRPHPCLLLPPCVAPAGALDMPYVHTSLTQRFQVRIALL